MNYSFQGLETRDGEKSFALRGIMRGGRIQPGSVAAFLRFHIEAGDALQVVGCPELATRRHYTVAHGNAGVPSRPSALAAADRLDRSGPGGRARTALRSD